MSSITIENVTKQFGTTVAIKDLSLHIEDREFLVVVGPTGAGKTTTLRCVAGLETPETGRILMDGQEMSKVSPAGRDIAFVFQNYALYPRKTVFENMAFPLYPRDFTAAEIRTEVGRVARMLHIEHLLTRRPGQLSGGEQQRVALGRAMVRMPRAFLMDEPLTNLDFQLRAQMRSELKRIQQDLEATFFYVTNDQVEALSMGDRVAVLREGVLQQVGPPQEVYEKPANLFVASFIGSVRMNFIKCAYDGDSGALIGGAGDKPGLKDELRITNYEPRPEGWRLVLPNRLRDAALTSRDPAQMILGVRPEDVQLLPGGNDPSASLRTGLENRFTGNDHLEGEVYVVEPLGDRNIYDVQLGPDLIKVKTPASFTLETGAPVSVQFNMERIHLFDAVTTTRLQD